jgi:hypothetical protein
MHKVEQNYTHTHTEEKIKKKPHFTFKTGCFSIKEVSGALVTLDNRV